MTTTPPIINEAEGLIHRLADLLTRPRARECLACYVARMLEEFSCDGTQRHALRYRDAMAPRATALRERLGRMGGWCDCEILLNAYQPVLEPADDDDGVDELPPCAGVRRGSVTPCSNWRRIRLPW